MFQFKSVAFIAIISILACCACNSTQSKQESSDKIKTPVDSLYELVIAKHDTVMPKISNLEGLQQKLRKQLEGLSDAETDKVQKDSILNLLTKLQKGHDAMFDWMGEFKNHYSHEEFYAKSSEAELIKYLKSEEAKIEKVAVLMLSSMAEGKAFLND